MAVMNTLRDKMGKIVVGAIGFAIVAFIGTDLLGPNSFLFGRDNNVGEIAGQNIVYDQFQGAVDEAKANYTLNFNRQPTDRELPTIRQQAWDRLISDIAFGEQMDALGVSVTPDEVWDMVQGKNVDPVIKQSFIDPETGQFDSKLVLNHLQTLDQLPVQAKVQWQMFESNLAPGRRRIKFDNMMLMSNYVTEEEAQLEYNAQNDVAEVKYLYIPYYAVSDSMADVNDNQLNVYLNEHKEEYKVENSRTLEYVSFSVLPSAADSAYVRDGLNELSEEFKTVEDDSVYARVNSDLSTYFGTYNVSNLPAQLQANSSNLTEGDVRGAYLENNYYKIYKVSKIAEDTVGTTKASHILFKWEDDTDAAKAKTKKEANAVLRQLQSGADFAELAKEHGTDGTASRGGDLGWFTEGRKMVKEFDEAVFAAKGKGLINKLVETQFGYHIVKTTEEVSYLTYKVGTIAHEIIASDETRDEAFRKADYFASVTNNFNDFQANAEKDGYATRASGDLFRNDRRIGSLGEARQIVQWVFRDAEEGTISEVFDLDSDYVVAVMTGEEKEGYAALNNVKAQVSLKVKNQLKADQIISEIDSKSGSLEDIAEEYGSDANVYSMSDLKISTSTLTSVGLAPEAIGKAFGLNSGERTAAFAVDNGVILLELLNKTTAPEIADYSIFENQVKQRVRGRTSYNIDQAVKDKANISDERYKFY